MKKTIKDPYKVKNIIFIVLILGSGVGIGIGGGCSSIEDNALAYIISNLSLGCFASAIVAWILEISNIRKQNQKANAIYENIYFDFKFCIRRYIDTWAELWKCAVGDNLNEEKKHEWFKWYTLCKEAYSSCEEARQKELILYFTSRLKYSAEEAERSIEKIITQEFNLRINDVYNDEIEKIISDFRFESHAISYKLSLDISNEEFWKVIEITNRDLHNYINSWTEIRYYNSIKFEPYQIRWNEEDLLTTVMETKDTEKLKKVNAIHNIIKRPGAKFAGFLIIALCVPVLVDILVFGNNIPSNISNETWAGFLGSYIGGLCTLGAVFITIHYNDKNLEKQRKSQEQKDEEKNRLSIRPYLDTRISGFDQHIVVGANDRVIHVRSETRIEILTTLDDITRKQIQANSDPVAPNQVHINYMIRNVGSGSAVDMIVKLNGFEERIAVAKDESVQLLCIVYTHRNLPCDLKIHLEYSDVEDRGRYKKDDVIRIEKNETGKYVESMIKNGKQELIKRETVEDRSYS